MHSTWGSIFGGHPKQTTTTIDGGISQPQQQQQSQTNGKRGKSRSIAAPFQGGGQTSNFQGGHRQQAPVIEHRPPNYQQAPEPVDDLPPSLYNVDFRNFQFKPLTPLQECTYEEVITSKSSKSV